MLQVAHLVVTSLDRPLELDGQRLVACIE